MIFLRLEGGCRVGSFRREIKTRSRDGIYLVDSIKFTMEGNGFSSQQSHQQNAIYNGLGEPFLQQPIYSSTNPCTIYIQKYTPDPPPMLFYFCPRYHLPMLVNLPEASNIAMFGPTLLTSARNAPNQLYRST